MDIISSSNQQPVNNFKTLSFDDKINIAFQFNKLSNVTKNVLIKTYATLMVNLIVASFGALFSIYLYRPHFILQLLLTIISVILLFYSFDLPTYKRFILLNSITFLMGITSGDMIGLYINIDPSIVLSAFVVSSGLFLTFTIFTLISKDNRKLIYYGSLIFSLGVFNLFLIIGNVFFGFTSGIFKSILLSVVLLISVLFIIYDTQLIIYKIENLGNYDFIQHSLILFIDFIDLFRVVLSIFGEKESNKKKNK